MNILLEKYFDFIKKLLPQSSAAAISAIGLDLGSNTCKLVELSQKGDRYLLINLSELPVKSTDPEATVKSIISKMSTPPVNVNTAISGKGTLIRYIELPQMSYDDLNESFAIEAEKYFPFSKDQIYTDCYILDSKVTTKDMKVMAVASKKELVDARVKMFSTLGIPSEFIGINTIALVNAVTTLGTGQEKEPNIIAILDIGDSMSSLTIIESKVPLFSRDIYIGGHELTKRISNALGIEYKDAVAYKLDPKDKKEEVLSACESALSNLIQELRLSFDYFASECNLEVEQLVLVGGSAKLTGLVELATTHLEVETIIWNPFNKLDVGEGCDNKNLKEDISKYAVAIGLALYDYD